jgi:hypothetical protein
VATAAGPIGWLTLGAGPANSWDCWKPVVLDTSTAPSSGRLLRDVLQHPNVRGVDMDGPGGSMVVTNVLNNRFNIVPVALPDGIALHAEAM